jgi:hypothetical protein
MSKIAKDLLINELRKKKVSYRFEKLLKPKFNQKEIQLVKAIFKVETLVRPSMFRLLELIYAYFRIILFLTKITKSYNTTLGPLQIGVFTSFKWMGIEPTIKQLIKEPVLLMTKEGACSRIRFGLDFYYSQTNDLSLSDLESFSVFYNGPNANLSNKIPYYQVLEFAGYKSSSKEKVVQSVQLDLEYKRGLENAVNSRLEKLKKLVEHPEKLGCSVILINKNSRSIFFEKYFGNQLKNEPCLTQPRLVASIAKFPLFLQVFEKTKLQNNSIINDKEVNVSTNTDTFSIRNADNKYRGAVSLKYAFSNSINTIAIQLIQQLGIKNYISYIRKCNIHRPLPNSDLLALGAFRLTGRELLTLFSPIMNDGHIVYYHQRKKKNLGGQKVFLDSTIKKIKESLRDTIINGTGKYLDKLQNDNIIGKTGTSEKNRDFWFIGTTGQDYYGLVWIGNYDESEVVGKNGYRPSATRFAVPMWSDISYFLNNFM